MSISIQWTDLKTLQFDNSWHLYYIENYNLQGVLNNYICVTGNTNHQYHTKVQNDNKIDFETNYKNSSTKVNSIDIALGKILDVGKSGIVQTTPFSSNSVEFNGEGIFEVITKDTTEDVDFKVTYTALLNGGVLQAENAVAGDYFVAQVIDKDGVYYPAGTVLKTWIPKWYALVDNMKMDLTTPQAGNIPANVYLRIKYTSTGTSTDVNLIINYKLNKDLS